jgi:holo-[acyl-carrier protein] synthase
MIVGIGIDLVDVARVRRLLDEEHAERARERLFSPREIELAGAGAGAIESLAARFAAKEAAMKALGTGWGEGIGFLDFEVTRDGDASPRLVLHGEAARLAQARGLDRWHVTLTHTRTTAIAWVLAEAGAPRAAC